MESLSRPPHRRRQSSSNAGAFAASFSMKNPYDDVLFSGGGTKARPFGAHEYSEIFSGSSSSIPVLDLPGLDERGVSGECCSSKLDYSNIFGGLRDDDVAVPYEELLNGVKKPKHSDDETGNLANTRLPVNQPESLHSSGNFKRFSGDSADQSADGVKQQFNLSFNKTSQKSIDISKGKTHIAQLRAVPGFTYFVDGTQQMQRKEDDSCVPLLKREVSRTWSFSSDVEAIKGKGGSSSDNSHTPDKSRIVPPTSSQLGNLREHNDLEELCSSFLNKEDVSGKIGSDSLPPLFEEEIDESSVAGVSAAFLKKAIEQAQESIRIAKMIMEKKKDSISDGSIPRPKGRLKVEDNEENRKYIEMKNTKEQNFVKTHERLDPIFLAFKDLNGKIDAFRGQNENTCDPGKAEVEKVRVNIEAAKEHSGAVDGASNKFSTSRTQNEALCDAKKVVIKELGNNVEAVEACEGVKISPGSEAEAECRTTNLEYGQVVENNNLFMSRHDLASYFEEMGTGKETLEQKEVGPEEATEPAERTIITSQKSKKLENIVDEASAQVDLTIDLTKGSERISEMVERSTNISPSTLVRENVDDVGANSRISQEDEVVDEGQNATEDLEECKKITDEHEEGVNTEHLKFPDLKVDNLMNDQPNMYEKEAMEWEEIEKKSVDVLSCGGSGQRRRKCWDEEKNGMRLGEALTSFENKENLNEILVESISKREPEAFPEIKDVVEKLNTVHEPEIIGETLNNLRGEEGKILLGAIEQNEIDESHMEIFEDEVRETKQEGINYAEFQKIEVFWGTEETNILGEAETSAEIQDKPVFQEAACERDTEAVDAKSNETSTSSNEIHSDYHCTTFCETQEPCDIDLNNLVEENSSTSEVAENSSAMETEKKERLPPLHQEDDDVLQTDNLPRSASEDNFSSSNLHNAFEGLSSDYKNESFGSMNTNNEEKLPTDEGIPETNDRIHNIAQEAVDKFNVQNFPEVHYPGSRTAEHDLTDVLMVSEQTSESDGRSESTSSHENMDDLSVNESDLCAENTKSETSDEEEVRNDPKISSEKIAHIQSDRVSLEERCEGEYFRLHVEPNEPTETEKFMGDDRTIETGEILEKINESGETSTMEVDCAKENVTNFDKEDQQQRIEAIKRGRAREKDRIAAERAMREARERAFAEAQVRAEKAAVERAAAEARQRFMAEAQEKLEKASTATKRSSDKASTEAKLRSERAAVERATAEARERALEKAMSSKTSTEGRSHTDKPAEKSRNNGLKHSFSSSDLEKIDGTSNESAKRSKARLERHQRIMERAAKALAEKNMRDHLAQKEQAERNRLAESLDADVKRWVIGKEGNLRALLSTLQYILGPNSGWQPISLTEIITTPAVKKAYRKATLYVHPDKLQQRGASIQQKYICEKVFDLLKAAWNRFNSEER